MSSKNFSSRSPKRVKRREDTARVAHLQAVLPAQRLQRRVAHRGADQLAKLHMRAGRSQRRRTVRGRGDRELIRTGPGRGIARIQTAHREPLQRGSLGLRHRYHRPRHRPHRQRTIDQQQRIDGAIDLFPPRLILAPVCRIARTAALPCTPAVTAAVTSSPRSSRTTTAA